MNANELTTDSKRPLTPIQHRYGPFSYAPASQRNWRLCTKCSCLHFAGNAVCAAGGVHDHSHVNVGDHSGFESGALIDGMAGLNLEMGLESGWKRCFKCQVVFRKGMGEEVVGGRCPGGGIHEVASLGGSVGLLAVDSEAGNGKEDAGRGVDGGENGEKWKHCRDCHGLSLTSDASHHEDQEDIKICATGGNHSLDGKEEYVIYLSPSKAPDDKQNENLHSTPQNWKHCRKCNLLAYDGYNACSGGGSHVSVDEACYTMIYDAPRHGKPDGEHGWRLCSGCYCLGYQPLATTSSTTHNTISSAATNTTTSTKVCPSTEAEAGQHVFFPEKDYIVKTAKTQPTLLEDNWARCKYCFVLYHLPAAPESGGKCYARAEGGKHVDGGRRRAKYWLLASRESDRELVCDGQKWRERMEEDPMPGFDFR